MFTAGFMCQAPLFAPAFQTGNRLYSAVSHRSKGPVPIAVFIGTAWLTVHED
jgi:hypothetical protein